MLFTKAIKDRTVFGQLSKTVQYSTVSVSAMRDGDPTVASSKFSGHAVNYCLQNALVALDRL